MSFFLLGTGLVPDILVAIRKDNRSSELNNIHIMLANANNIPKVLRDSPQTLLPSDDMPYNTKIENLADRWYLIWNSTLESSDQVAVVGSEEGFLNYRRVVLYVYDSKTLTYESYILYE